MGPALPLRLLLIQPQLITSKIGWPEVDVLTGVYCI